MERDIFICHASEDKSEVVRPLVKALQKQDITCWVDEGEIKWGDSITQKVNEGLKISRFVIVVLSKSFMNKNWPKRELYAALDQEATSGEVKVLPLLVGNKVVRENILTELPLLKDKRYLTWDGLSNSVVDEALNRLSRTRKEVSSVIAPAQDATVGEDIPLPKLRKRSTQRDRDLLSKETFKVVKEYFQRALSQLQPQYIEVETDFTEIHATKFIAKIYFLGEVKNQCKIWIGGLSTSDGIGYSENWFNIDSDNSFNEMISIEDDGFELKLKFTLGFMSQHPNKAYLTPLDAAETLWIRFSSPLEHL